MTRRSRQHTSDEFGRPGLGSAAAIGDRALGAAPGVIVDGLVERESGRTPGPGFSGRAIAVGFGVMLTISLVLMVTMTILGTPRSLPTGSYPGVWIGLRSTRANGSDTRFGIMSDAADGGEVSEWRATVSANASITIDGRPADITDLAELLDSGMWRANVTAGAEGVMSRVEVVTQEGTW